MGIATSATALAAKNATDTARRWVSGTSRTTGRATAMRKMNKPIAAINATNTTERAAISRGVAAVSEIEGTTNCGAGPGLGPAALVTEIAAKRGSTDSVYVTSTTGGGRLTTTLASGTVRTSAACAQATVG